MTKNWIQYWKSKWWPQINRIKYLSTYNMYVQARRCCHVSRFLVNPCRNRFCNRFGLLLGSISVKVAGFRATTFVCPVFVVIFGKSFTLMSLRLVKTLQSRSQGHPADLQITISRLSDNFLTQWLTFQCGCLSRLTKKKN